MLLIRCVLLFPCLISYGLLCISKTAPYTLPIDKFDYKKTATDLNRLAITKPGKSALCRVRFYISKGPSWRLVFNFTHLLLGSDLTDKDVRLETTIQDYTIEKTLLTNTLEYACSGSDGCERNFTLDHLKWFVKEHFETFHELVEQLIWTGDSRLGSCFDENNRFVKCSLRIGCMAIRSNKDNDFQQSCASGGGISDEYFEIITTIDTKTRKEKQSIMLRCRYNGCNSGDNILKLENMLPLYDLLPMRTALVYEQTSIKVNTTTAKAISSTILLSSPKMPTSSNKQVLTMVFHITSDTSSSTTPSAFSSADLATYLPTDITTGKTLFTTDALTSGALDEQLYSGLITFTVLLTNFRYSFH